MQGSASQVQSQPKKQKVANPSCLILALGQLRKDGPGIHSNDASMGWKVNGSGYLFVNCFHVLLGGWYSWGLGQLDESLLRPISPCNNNMLIYYSSVVVEVEGWFSQFYQWHWWFCCSKNALIKQDVNMMLWFDLSHHMVAPQFHQSLNDVRVEGTQKNISYPTAAVSFLKGRNFCLFPNDQNNEHPEVLGIV